jgi:hypothetical protein
MRLMRRHDPQAKEDGSQLLLPHAARYVNELISEFNREGDHGLRCSLLELIGKARSPQALPVLVEQLYGGDESLRSWAIRSNNLCLAIVGCSGWLIHNSEGQIQ